MVTEAAPGGVGRSGPVPVAPGLLLGIGLGGFVDGILLHQILQWHHMLTATDRYPSSTIVGLEANTLADGLFHAVTTSGRRCRGTSASWRSARCSSSSASACRTEP